MISSAFDGCRIRIPNLGWVRMREALRFAGKITSATISRVADRWFVSVAVDTQEISPLPKAENQSAVGVDLGKRRPQATSLRAA
jgi:putative transposase